MAKALKVNYKELKAEYNSENELVGTIEELSEDGTESNLIDVNITKEIKELLNTLEDEDKITITVKKFKETVPKEKKPIFKYRCGCGDNEIKSSVDYLDITCNECGEAFVLEENDK